MDFDYKKYSLYKLNEWMHDAISCDEATPQEIYDVIKGVVSENYYTYKNQTERCYELLALLNGNGRGHIEAYDKLVCDKDDLSPECQGAWNDFWSEVDDYVKQSIEEKGYEWTPASEDKKSEYYYDYNRNDLNRENPFKDRVVKWQLPVEVHPSGEYYVQFPDDLLEATNLKEGDTVEWVDQGNGSYILRKA